MNKYIVWLSILGGFAMTGCQYLIFVYAPEDSTLGLVQKIFYVHLPLAWWSFASFFVVFAASIAYLKTRRLRWDHLAHAAAEWGLVLNTLSFVTGSIWARHSWGVWWTWDPKLTTALILWFLYAGYLAVRHMDMPPERRNLLCAVLGIVAFVDVPLVFVAARLWRAIHPAGAFERGSWLTPEMQLTAIACVASLGLLWFAILALRTRQISQQQRIEQHTADRLNADEQ